MSASRSPISGPLVLLAPRSSRAKLPASSWAAKTSVRCLAVPASETDATIAAARSVRARTILSFMGGLLWSVWVTSFDARHARHGCRRPREGLRSIRGSICSRSISILRWTRPLERWASVRVCRAFRFRGDTCSTVLVVAVAVWQQVQIWTTAAPGDRRVVVPLSLAFAVALLLRDRFPVAARVGAFAALGLWAGFAPHDHGSSASYFVGSMLAFWIAGLTTDWRAAVAGLASGLLLVAYDESVLPGGGFGDFLFSAVILTGVWVAASALAHRGRHARTLQLDLAAAQAEREERARQAVTAERTRIARELHDVIAHNLSVAIVQLTAALPDLHEDGEATRRVQAAETACRQALDEMRRLLGVLRTDESEPELSPVTRPRLASTSSSHDEGRRPRPGARHRGTPAQPPPGIDLAAYRIIQEALTNALKHGNGTANLSLHYRPDEIEIEAVNQRRDGDPKTDGSGRGLVGMRERAALYGGSLDAGPTANGGYRVAARLPLEPARDDPHPARRRPDARPRRLPLDHRPRARPRSRRRSRRRPRRDRERTQAPPRRRPDGHPHATPRRPPGNPHAARRTAPAAHPRPHHLRPRRVRLRRTQERRQRLPAQGRPRRRAHRGDPHRRRRRTTPLPHDHPPPDRTTPPPPRARQRSRPPSRHSPTANSTSSNSSPAASPTPRSPNASTSAPARSRPTSTASSPNSTSATAPRPSSTPTKPDSSNPANPPPKPRENSPLFPPGTPPPVRLNPRSPQTPPPPLPGLFRRPGVVALGLIVRTLTPCRFQIQPSRQGRAKGGWPGPVFGNGPCSGAGCGDRRSPRVHSRAGWSRTG